MCIFRAMKLMQFWIEITFMYRLDVCFKFEFFMIGSSYWNASAPKKNYHIRNSDRFGYPKIEFQINSGIRLKNYSEKWVAKLLPITYLFKFYSLHFEKTSHT